MDEAWKSKRILPSGGELEDPEDVEEFGEVRCVPWDLAKECVEVVDAELVGLSESSRRANIKNGGTNKNWTLIVSVVSSQLG